MLIGRSTDMTTKRTRFWAAGIGLFLFVAVAGAQTPAQTKNDSSEAQATEKTDHAAAYYHYMLAQRYKDLIHLAGDFFQLLNAIFT